MRSVKLLATVLLFTSLTWADSQVRIVRLSLVDGPVQLDRATGEGFERAIMNMPIAQGMQLWTRNDSRAEVEFEDGNTIRLTPGTKIEFTNLVLRTDGSRSTLVRIESGRAYVNYSKKSGEEFRIQVGQHEIALRDSVHFRADVASDKAEFAVIGGELDARQDLKIKKHNTAILDLTSGAFQLAKGVTPVVEDDWDEYRSDYHDKYAKAAYKGSSYYGRSDLNYYGAWFNSPFGDCWRPYGFDASRSPYSAGAWAYYPGYGYTFVSAYPWGWQPFRYGAWNYAGGLGWCWTPGMRFYGYGSTPIYRAGSGYVPVEPPTQPPTQPPQNPTPPTTATGGHGPGHRPFRGGPGLIPVGDIDTTTWRAKHDPGDYPWRGGKHHHGGDSAPVSTGATASGAGGATVPPPPGARASEATNVQPRYRGKFTDPDGNDSNARAARDAERQHQREMQREQRQTQRAMQSERRSYDRGSSGGGASASHASAPAPAPRMSAPAPAPQMSAPPPSPPPSRGEIKTNVPK